MGTSRTSLSYVFCSKRTWLESFSWTFFLFHFFFLDLPPASAARALASLLLISTFAILQFVARERGAACVLKRRRRGENGGEMPANSSSKGNEARRERAQRAGAESGC